MAVVPGSWAGRVMTRQELSIAVDARMIASSGIGTYLRNTLPPMIAARPDWRFVLLGSRARLADAGLGTTDNVEIRESSAPIYSIREQLAFATSAPRRADLFWAPHYNIPLSRTARLVVTVHDVMHLTLPEYSGGWLRRQYAARMYAAVRRRASAVICVSDFTRRELERVVGAGPPVHVVHNGVHPSWFELSGSADAAPAPRPYVVFVGLAKPHKNLAGLLEAFAMIRDRVPHELVLVGSNRDALRTVDQKIDDMVAPLRDQVRFVERLELPALQRCIAGADALVQPSLCEGFGLPPLEAMAAGTPCLVSRIDPLVELCRDSAAYCDPCDPADIARELLRLLEDRGAAAVLSRRGRERARAFSWERTAAETVTVFEHVLSS
jgi:glycosyltransferase involved in cell wall biosynthesis